MIQINGNEYFTRINSLALVNKENIPDDVLSHVYINSGTLKDVFAEGESIAFPERTLIRIYVDPAIESAQFSISVILNGSSEIDTLEWSKEIVTDNVLNYEHCTNMNTPNSSYMLARVNPKISGNIKVVVDEDEDIYIDAIKANAELTKRKYRKVPVSYTDYYGRNVAAYIKNMPSINYLYDVDEDYHQIFSVVNDFKDQYVDIYRYGVTTNTDKFYKENFAMLAPFKVGEQLPDFFLIFKIDGCIDLTRSFSDIEIMKKMLKEGKIVKSFDMREGSKLGTYIRTIQTKSKDSHAPLYVAYNPSQFNTYTGIALDKGVVTTIYESPYSLKYKNQVQADNFYTLGYERNKMISDNIINFEFMFNDETSETFNINTYFGLYVKINGFDKKLHNINGEIRTEDGSLINIDYTPNSDDLIYCFADEENCYRLKGNVRNYDKFISFKDKADKPIIESYCSKVSDVDFLIMKFNDTLEVGEHLKLIDSTDSTNIKIYELILSDYPKYQKSKLSELSINKGVKNNVNYTFYRKSLYVQDDVEELLPLIAKGFNSLCEDGVYYVNVKGNQLSIVKDSDVNIEFERILSDCFANSSDSENIKDEKISFIGINPILYVTSSSNEKYNAVNFEILGNRYYYKIPFIKTEGKGYFFEYKGNISDIKYKYLLVKGNDNNFTYLNTVNNMMFIPSYRLNNNSYILFTDQELGEQLSIYSVESFNFGLCSIFNVKDFNFNVMDALSNVAMAGEALKHITDKNNNIDFDILSDSSLNFIKDIPSEAFTSYISKNDSVPIYAQNPVINVTDITVTTPDGSTVVKKNYVYQYPKELSLNKYLKFKFDRNIKKSDISLVSPYNCKWVATGTNVLGNNIKLTYNNNLLKYNDTDDTKSVKSYFIPAVLDSSVQNDANDIFSKLSGYFYCPNVQYKKYFSMLFDSEINDDTVRNLIYNGNSNIDDLIYNSSEYRTKYSKVYSRGLNTVEFISSGVKVNFKSNYKNVINTDKYNNYSAILITTTGRNPYNSSDVELFIDENSKQIALIWHQNVNSLLYGKNTGTEYTDESGTFYVYNYPINVSSKRIYSIKSGTGYKLVIPTKSNVQNISGQDIFMIGGKNINTNTDIFAAYLDDVSINKPENLNVTKILSKVDGSTYYTVNHILSKDNNVLSEFPENMSKLNNLSELSELYLISDSSTFNINVCSFKDLKNTIKNCVVYIKNKDNKLEYYDNKTANLFTVDVIDPVEETFIKTNRSNDKFFVHPTYFEPELVDLFEFEYDNESAAEAFKKNFRLSNTQIKDVHTIEQLWFLKYSLETKYCTNINDTAFGLGIDFLNNYSIFKSSWDPEFFNKYTRDVQQDEYDRINLELSNVFITNDGKDSKESNIYDYLPKTPKYLLENTTLEIKDVISDIKKVQEIFDASSYTVDNKYYDSTKTSNNIESPNFN